MRFDGFGQACPLGDKEVSRPAHRCTKCGIGPRGMACFKAVWDSCGNDGGPEICLVGGPHHHQMDGATDSRCQGLRLDPMAEMRPGRAHRPEANSDVDAHSYAVRKFSACWLYLVGS
jgi:hypothetical protein